MGDLKIVAYYAAGESPGLDWKYMIAGDGNVERAIFGYGGHRVRLQTRLSREDTAGIVAEFAQEAITCPATHTHATYGTTCVWVCGR
jgi:hypothetical protein